MYVIRRINQGGGFVAKPGHRSSYTYDIRYVRKFITLEEAEHNRCPGNEIIVRIEET